jgi:hypothetical protein
VVATRSIARVPVFALFVAAAAVVLAATGSAAAARASSAPSSFGPIPYNGTEQSRCQGVHVGNHVVFPGKEVTATTSAGICGSAPKDITWSWSGGISDQTHGCGHDATTCRFTAVSTGGVYALLCINGANIQGAWQSCDYYGVVDKGYGVIEGYVKDKDGGPVAGADVKAYGPGNVSTTTGADGYYAMQVKAGSYRIVPSGGPHGKSAPDYIPKYNATHIADGTSGRADFQLQAGVELALHFAQSAAPADGLHVVNGTITTTEFGKPLPNVGVQLEAMPGETYDKAVTGGPRASVCSQGSRQWPTGTMALPDGAPVSVTTDATGHYDLQITVGTTPGRWTLEATAKNADGTLSTDVTSASDTQSITFTSLSKAATPPDFINEFDLVAKSTTAVQQISPSASPMVNTLAQVTATSAGGARLGGLAYALVNGSDGQSMLVFPANKPPLVNTKGEVPDAGLANLAAQVLDPQEWTGAGLPATVTNAASLQSVMAGGLLAHLPTLAEFDSAKPVQGWKLIPKNAITVFSQSFEYLGWGYPGISQPGACY